MTGANSCHVSFGGRMIDEACERCGHMLMVHTRPSGHCSLCEAVAQAKHEADTLRLELKQAHETIVAYLDGWPAELDLGELAAAAKSRQWLKDNTS
jgi:hypothetical protein